MWPWKRKKKIPEFEFSIARVRLGEEIKDVVTYLPMEKFFKEGLDPKAIVGMLTELIAETETPVVLEKPLINPENFVRHRIFFDHLHSLVADIVPKIPGFVEGARQQGTGYFYLIDARTPDPHGAPLEDMEDDVVGAFELDSGRMKSNSYWANQNYKLVTENGMFNLPWLERELLKVFY